MADVAKKTSTVQQTVSSPHTPNGTSPLCELTTTQSGSFSDLSLPHEDDDTSLQDLIDSELALRIARSPSPPVRGDVNTRFILEERNHSFQSYTGNDTFFFSTLEDSPPNNGATAGATSPEEFPPSPPRCLPQSLAAFDPFTTTIDTESSPSADSELVCLAGELASPLDPPPGGVLLDFSEGDLPDDIGPYQTDTNPSRVVENGTLLDLSEGISQELVGAFPEEVADDFLDPFGSSYREGSVTPDERQQGVDLLDECSLPDLVSPASSPTNLDDDAAGIVNNSMSSDDVNNPSSVVECCVVAPNIRSPGAVLIPEIDVIPPDDDDQVDEDLDMYVSSGYGVADDAEGDENEWTTVAEAVGSPEEETPPMQQPEVAVNGAGTPTSVSSCSESVREVQNWCDSRNHSRLGGEINGTVREQPVDLAAIFIRSPKENIDSSNFVNNAVEQTSFDTPDLTRHCQMKGIGARTPERCTEMFDELDEWSACNTDAGAKARRVIIEFRCSCVRSREVPGNSATTEPRSTLRGRGGTLFQCACLARSIRLRINKWVTPSPFVGGVGGAARKSSEGRVSRQPTRGEARGSWGAVGGGVGHVPDIDRRSILEHVVLFDETRSVRRSTAQLERQERYQGYDVTHPSHLPYGIVLKAVERRLEVGPSRAGLLAQISVNCWEHDMVPSAGITRWLLVGICSEYYEYSQDAIMKSDLSTEMVTEKKSKKKRSEGGEVTKTKKTKKNKKSDSEKENISVVSTSQAFLQKRLDTKRAGNSELRVRDISRRSLRILKTKGGGEFC
uniref:Uncharacterized protein n=1 Tax=Timema tahoe TaxID=61484 RepID=A0A7R9NXQ1_9NEOP|nr:unnamed protein product [Timema tahoe]